MNLSSDFPQKIQQRVHALANIRMVLVRTSHPGNVGQVARAMANMGLRELVITSPRFPDMCEQPEAIALASGATDVLAQAQIVPDEFFPGGRVTCPQGGKCFDFFFSGQWPWEASGLQVKGQKQKF